MGRRKQAGRRPKEERALRVRAIRRPTPEPHKLARAVIALALARTERAERSKEADNEPR